jgi:hypothetical protein
MSLSIAVAQLNPTVGDVSGNLKLVRDAREQAAELLSLTAAFIELRAARAEAELDTVLPSYTHRQRAQPISLAYLRCGYGAMFARDALAYGNLLTAVDELSLGVGAIAAVLGAVVVLAAVSSPIWVPVLVIVGIIALIKRSNPRPPSISA